MRKQFSKSDIKQFLEEVPYAQDFMDKKSNVAQVDNLLYVNNQPLFIHLFDEWVPSLKLLLKKIVLPKVVVDKGAIKFVVNGADIMRPGITQCDDFEKDSFVVIVDETVGTPIAIGKCHLSSKELMEQTGGKHITNLHYVGDEYWNKN